MISLSIFTFNLLMFNIKVNFENLPITKTFNTTYFADPYIEENDVRQHDNLLSISTSDINRANKYRPLIKTANQEVRYSNNYSNKHKKAEDLAQNSIEFVQKKDSKTTSNDFITPSYGFTVNNSQSGDKNYIFIRCFIK